MAENYILFVLALLVFFPSWFMAKRWRKVLSIKHFLVSVTFFYLFIKWTPQKVYDSIPKASEYRNLMAYYGCEYEISSRAVFCNDSSRYGTGLCYCTNMNAMATIAHCFKQYGSDSSAFINSCKDRYNVAIPHDVYEDSLSLYNRSARPVQITKEARTMYKQKIDYPLKLDELEILTYKFAYDQFLGNYIRSLDFGIILILFLGMTLCITGCFNWSKYYLQNSRNQKWISLRNRYRKFISIPALLNLHKNAELKFYGIDLGLVPTRIESIIVVAFTMLCCWFFFKDIHYIENDPVFPLKSDALMRYFAVRCSILSSLLFPVVILFAGRNNVLQFLTKISYSTFIMYHRWISRILVLLISIHSILYGIYDYGSGIRFKPFHLSKLVTWGLLGTCSGIFLIFKSILYVRRNWYEVFLIFHIALASSFLLAAINHVDRLPCLWFYYFSIALWIYDRVLRLERIFSFGFPLSRLTVVGDDTIRISIPKHTSWMSKPGGHVFIHFLTSKYFWQSHPFTYIESDSGKEIIIYVKVKDGVTRMVYKDLIRSDQHWKMMRIAVEGSYGHMTPASNFSNKIFVASGSGIPGIYAEALALAKVKKPNETIQLNWTVRDYESLIWFYDELMTISKYEVRIIVNITRPDYENNRINSFRTGDLSQANNKMTEGIEGQQKLLAKLNERIEITHGRPLLGFLVSEALANSTGSVAFITCGHPTMVDRLRSAVTKVLLEDDKQRCIDFFEQLEVWA